MRAKKIILFVVVLVALIVIWKSGLHEFLNFVALVKYEQYLSLLIEQYLILSVIIFILIYVINVVFSLPFSSFLTVTSGFLFGGLWGGVWTVIGATLGASILFFLVQFFLRDMMKNKLGDRLQRFEEGFTKNAISYLLFIRLVPAFPFFLVNVAVSLLAVPYRIFLITTFVGIIPASFIVASVGNGLGVLLAQGTPPNLSIIFTPSILFSLLGLAVLSLLPMLLQKGKSQ